MATVMCRLTHVLKKSSIVVELITNPLNAACQVHSREGSQRDYASVNTAVLV